jgi:hypothetical protein
MLGRRLPILHLLFSINAIDFVFWREEEFSAEALVNGGALAMGVGFASLVTHF